MKLILITLLLLHTVVLSFAQKQKYISVAVYNTHSAFPFSKFTGLFTEVVHPGVEFIWGTDFYKAKKHDWFWDARMGYFYHRFVQHAIPIYANLGYRYKFNTAFSADMALGAGYLHSVPATAKLKINDNGDYENNIGIGRPQLNACFGITAGYLFSPQKPASIKLFVTYQQRLQMPFVRSYVPMLPYNSFMIGVSRAIIRKKAVDQNTTQ